MKKTIIVLSFVLLFAFVVTANADPVDVCTNISGVQTEAPTGYIHLNNNTCIPNPQNGNPLKVSQVWGLTGQQTKTVPAGTTITDDAGNSYTCSKRVDTQGCSVLVELDYYKSAMRAIYAKLTELGLASQFPQFAYWGK